jgi:heme A synthase
MSTTTIRRSSRRAVTRLHLALTVTMLAAVALLRGEQVADDRGSDSSEKSLMIILAIGIGTVVAAAATAYVSSKTALFK